LCQPQVPSVYISRKFRNGQNFRLHPDRCLTGMFHHSFLGFYRKLTYFVSSWSTRTDERLDLESDS
jgi:hypothetical protein